jgi:hypothetical protein
MQTLRLYDPARRGANWTDGLRAGQVVAFAKRIDSGVPCTPDGEPFASDDAATCAVFDSLDDARGWCDASVQRVPAVRFDIFDHEGRAHSPLVTIVHPSHQESLEGSLTDLRRRTRIALALLAGGIPLMGFAYWTSPDRDPILPGFLGLNMVLVALRLFWMNQASREVARTSRDRLARHAASREPGGTRPTP